MHWLNNNRWWQLGILHTASDLGWNGTLYPRIRIPWNDLKKINNLEERKRNETCEWVKPADGVGLFSTGCLTCKPSRLIISLLISLHLYPNITKWPECWRYGILQTTENQSRIMAGHCYSKYVARLHYCEISQVDKEKVICWFLIGLHELSPQDTWRLDETHLFKKTYLTHNECILIIIILGSYVALHQTPRGDQSTRYLTIHLQTPQQQKQKPKSLSSCFEWN